MKPMDRRVSLCVDEMAIKPHLALTREIPFCDMSERRYENWFFVMEKGYSFLRKVYI